MSGEAKRLLEQATPLPWLPEDWHVFVGAGMSKRDVLQANDEHDAALAAYAVNRLPDYEVVLDALGMLLNDLDREDVGAMDPRLWESQGVARAALARLRESEAANVG